MEQEDIETVKEAYINISKYLSYLTGLVMKLKLQFNGLKQELTNGNCDQRHNATKCLGVTDSLASTVAGLSCNNPNEADAAETGKCFTVGCPQYLASISSIIIAFLSKHIATQNKDYIF